MMHWFSNALHISQLSFPIEQNYNPIGGKVMRIMVIVVEYLIVVPYFIIYCILYTLDPDNMWYVCND
jgi:hypothetical protein